MRNSSLSTFKPSAPIADTSQYSIPVAPLKRMHSSNALSIPKSETVAIYLYGKSPKSPIHTAPVKCDRNRKKNPPPVPPKRTIGIVRSRDTELNRRPPRDKLEVDSFAISDDDQMTTLSHVRAENHAPSSRPCSSKAASTDVVSGTVRSQCSPDVANEVLHPDPIIFFVEPSAKSSFLVDVDSYLGEANNKLDAIDNLFTGLTDELDMMLSIDD